LRPPPPLPSSRLLASSASSIFYSMGSRVANLAITERSRYCHCGKQEKGMPYVFHQWYLLASPRAILNGDGYLAYYFTRTCSPVSSTLPYSPSDNNYISLLKGRRRRCSLGPLSTFSRSTPPHVRCLHAPKPDLYVIMEDHSHVLGPLYVRFRQPLCHYATYLVT